MVLHAKLIDTQIQIQHVVIPSIALTLESLSERNQVPQQQRPVTITRGGGYPNSLSQNQVPEQETPVTITPDRGPVEVGYCHFYLLLTLMMYNTLF